jgi:hypothetical protein
MSALRLKAGIKTRLAELETVSLAKGGWAKIG